MALCFTAPILTGAAIGFFSLREALEVLTYSVLALTGGALTSVVLEEMVTEAHKGESSHLGPIALTPASPSPHRSLSRLLDSGSPAADPSPESGTCCGALQPLMGSSSRRPTMSRRGSATGTARSYSPT